MVTRPASFVAAIEKCSPALTELVLGILKKALMQSLLKADREVYRS